MDKAAVTRAVEGLWWTRRPRADPTRRRRVAEADAAQHLNSREPSPQRRRGFKTADIGLHSHELLHSHIDSTGRTAETRSVEERGWAFWEGLAEGDTEEEAAMAAASLSVQSSQREAVRKMLSLNASSTEAEWDQATQDDGTWKVLIYDKYCRDIISPLFKVGQLKQMNVTLYMMLHSERERIPDVPAIYFVQPTEANVDRICQDAQSGLYDSMHLNFSSELPR
jgi:hypothetical protein